MIAIDQITTKNDTFLCDDAQYSLTSTESPLNSLNDSTSDSTLESKLESKLDSKLDSTFDTKNNQKNRYFKCLHATANGGVICTGRYTGTKPKQAARRACTKLYMDAMNEGQTPEYIAFGMMEYTRGSTHKLWLYTGRRVTLPAPEKVPVYVVDPHTKKPLLDRDNFKIHKLDSNGEPIIYRYSYTNVINKLTDTCHSDYQKLMSYYQNIKN